MSQTIRGQTLSEDVAQVHKIEEEDHDTVVVVD